MITVICGLDTGRSRKYFADIKADIGSKQEFEAQEIRFEDLANLRFNLSRSSSLFSKKITFFAENLNKKLNLRLKKQLEEIREISKSPDIILYVWESRAARELKLSRLATVKEFAPSKNIFSLLDSLYPGNKVGFINTLSEVLKTEESGFVFYMLSRHIRQLLLISTCKIVSLSTWQYQKISSQSKKWDSEKLILLYEAFHKIDVRVKTSSSAFDLVQSLDILGCYFL